MAIRIKTSSVVKSQAPDFVNSDYPLFLRFLESYYEYMEHQSPPIILDVYVNIPIFTISLSNQDNYSIINFLKGELVEQKADPINPGIVTGAGEIFGINLSEDKTGATLSLINVGGRDKKFIPFSIGMDDPNLSIIRGVDSGTTITCRTEVKHNLAGVLSASHDLLNYQNFDTTLDEYMQFIKNEFAPNFPLTLNSNVDVRKTFMGLRDFYRSKGTENSFKFLFRALFNEEADLYFPEREVMRASGRLKNQFPSEYEGYSRDIRIKLNTTADVVSRTKQLSIGILVPLTSLQGRTIIGKTSGATAVIDKIFKLQYANRTVIESELINVIGGPFHSFEQVATINVPGEIDVDNWKILGGVGEVTLDSGGTGYIVGQKAAITGGGGVGAEVLVTEVGSNGTIKKLEVSDQGVGYSSEIPINLDLSGPALHSESNFVSGGVNVSLNENFNTKNPILLLSPDDHLGRGDTTLNALISSDPLQRQERDLGDFVPLSGAGIRDRKQDLNFNTWYPNSSSRTGFGSVSSWANWFELWTGDGRLLNGQNIPGLAYMDADGGGGYVAGAPKMLDNSSYPPYHGVAPTINSLGHFISTANIFYGNTMDLSSDSISGLSSLGVRIIDGTVAETVPGLGLQSHHEVKIHRKQTWSFWYKPTANVATGGRIIARDSGWPDANGFFALSVNTASSADATDYWNTVNLDFHTRTLAPLDPSTPNYADHIANALHQNEWHMFTISETYRGLGAGSGIVENPVSTLRIHYTDGITPTYTNTYSLILTANGYIADNGEECAVVLGGISDGIDKNSANVYGGHGAAGLYDELKFYNKTLGNHQVESLFRNPGDVRSLTGDWFISPSSEVSNNIFHQAYSLFNQNHNKYNYFTYGTDSDHISGETAPNWITLSNPGRTIAANGHDHGGSVGFVARDSLGLTPTALAPDRFDLINQTHNVNDREYDPGAKFKITSRSMSASDASTIYHHSFGTQIVRRNSIPGAVPKFGESVLRIVNAANTSGVGGGIVNRYSNTTVTIGGNHGYHEKSRITVNSTKDSPWIFPFLNFNINKRFILSWYYKTSNGYSFDSVTNHLPAASILRSPAVKFIVSDGDQDGTNQRYAVITKPSQTLSSLGVVASNSSYNNWTRDHMILDFTTHADVTSGAGDTNTTIATGASSASGTLFRNVIDQGFIEFSISSDDDGSGGRAYNGSIDYYDEAYIDGVQLEEVGSTIDFPTSFNVWPPGHPETVFNFIDDETATSNTKLVVSSPEMHFSYANNIPYDKDALYKISARVNGTAYGTGNISVGIIGIEHKEGVGKYITLGDNYNAFSLADDRYEAPIAQSNTTINTGGWTTINAYFQGVQTKNYISRAYRSFEANNYAFGSVVMSNGLGTNETSTPPYPIFLRGSTGSTGYANAVIDTTLGYGGTSSLQHDIYWNGGALPKFMSFANSLAISGTDEYVGSAWGDGDGADWVIKIPKTKRWIFSYYARSNNVSFPTPGGLNTHLYLRASDKPEANVALISGVAPTLTAVDTWQRFSGVLNFTENAELDASDHSNWSSVVDTYANSSITTFTSANALRGADINQIILNVGSTLMGSGGIDSGDNGRTVWYDGFMLEEQANTLITTPSEYYSGTWHGPGFGYSNPAPLGEETTHVRPYIAFNQGPGYSGYDSIDIDYIKLEAATNAIATLGITGNYIGLGRQEDVTAVLNSKQRLQDNHYYQIFSYLIKSGVSVERYEHIVKQLVHPAGTKLFGQVYLQSEMDSFWPHNIQFGPGQTAEMFPTNTALLDNEVDGIFGGISQIIRAFFFGPDTISELGGNTLISGENASVIWDFNPGDND